MFSLRRDDEVKSLIYTLALLGDGFTLAAGLHASTFNTLIETGSREDIRDWTTGRERLIRTRLIRSST